MNAKIKKKKKYKIDREAILKRVDETLKGEGYFEFTKQDLSSKIIQVAKDLELSHLIPTDELD